MIITAYRIVKDKYAGEIWSGIGARDHGGRWNSRGVAVVYTAENRSLAAIEQLVHLIKPAILKRYVVASIAFDGARVERVDIKALPGGWNDRVAPPQLRQIGDRWAATGRYPVLAVPSVIIPGEWNYLINPSHAEMDGMVKSDPEPFVYNDRLV